MTDDEVKAWVAENEAWLTPEERRQAAREFAAVLGYQDYRSVGIAGAEVLRTLVETRKALALCEWAAEGPCGEACPVCGACGEEDPREPHDPTCIFATMPRPKP